MNKIFNKIESFNLINEILDKDLITLKFENNMKFNVNEDIKLLFLENLISIFLFNEKKVLLLCDSLNDINNLSVINELKNKVIYNSDNEDDIIKKIKYQIKNLKETTGSTLINKVYLINRKLIKDNNKIESINDFFYKKEDQSLVDLYIKSREKIIESSKIYKYYSAFRIKNSKIDLSFNEICKAKQYILDNSIYDKYIKYRRYKDNTKLKILKDNIDREIIYKSIEKLKEINGYNTIIVPISNNKYTVDFKESYIHNTSMNDIDIDNLANIINVKYNSKVLYEKEGNKIKRYFFKKKYKNEKKIKEEKFKYLEQIIKLEIINIKSILDIEISNYKFLENVLVKSYYDELIRLFIRGNDIKAQMELIEKVLLIKDKLIFLENEIEGYDDSVKIILKYSYENIEDKKDMIEILNNIDLFKANYEIEKKEISDSNIVNYKLYDSIINSIVENLILKNTYINMATNYIWENKIKKNLKISNGSNITLDSNFVENYDDLFPLHIGINNKIDNAEFNNFDNIIILNDKSVSVFNNYYEYIKNITHEYNNVIMLYTYNKNNYFHNEMLNYLDTKYKDIKVNFKINNINIPFYIENEEEKFCILIDDKEKKDYDLYKEIYLISILKESNIKVIRVWIRDIWEDRRKAIDNINKELCKFH